MRITYVEGDATEVCDPGPCVLAHVCNDSGGWGKGFVVAVSRRWSEPESAYRRWARSRQDFVLGMVQLVSVADNVGVANMVAQHGYRSRSNPVAIRYDALDTCLAKLAEKLVVPTTVQMPRIGCGLAGGRWELIEPLIEGRLVAAGHPVIVFDLPPAP